MSTRYCLMLSVAAVLLAAAPTMGQVACPSCPPVQQACPPTQQFITQTILCPKMVNETRMTTRTDWCPEVRQRTLTVYDNVPETHAVQRQYTQMVNETRTRTEHFTVRKPVYRTVSRCYTEMVPTTEKRTGCRTVYKTENYTVKHKVCVDEGKWEHDIVCAPCDPCAQPVVQKRWVPKMKEKTVRVKCSRQVPETETFTYDVCVYKPVTRTVQQQVCEWVEEPCSREVAYTVCVPKPFTRTEYVTVNKCVPRQVAQNYTVMVPRQVQVPITVQVCKMVPTAIRTPTCPTPSVTAGEFAAPSCPTCP